MPTCCESTGRRNRRVRILGHGSFGSFVWNPNLPPWGWLLKTQPPSIHRLLLNTVILLLGSDDLLETFLQAVHRQRYLVPAETIG